MYRLSEAGNLELVECLAGSCDFVSTCALLVILERQMQLLLWCSLFGNLLPS